jgi:hypothetical protein
VKKGIPRQQETPCEHGFEITIWPALIQSTVAQIAHSAPADSFSGPL